MGWFKYNTVYYFNVLGMLPFQSGRHRSTDLALQIPESKIPLQPHLVSIFIKLL